MPTSIVNPAESVAADDRLTDDEFIQEDVPIDVLGPERRARQVFDGRLTAAALEVLWAQRDEAYAANENALTNKEVQAIRSFRLLEVRNLAPSEQVGSGLASKALTWRPGR